MIDIIKQYFGIYIILVFSAITTVLIIRLVQRHDFNPLRYILNFIVFENYTKETILQPLDKNQREEWETKKNNCKRNLQKINNIKLKN